MSWCFLGIIAKLFFSFVFFINLFLEKGVFKMGRVTKPQQEWRVRGRMLMWFKEKRDSSALLSLQPYQFVKTRTKRGECMNEMAELELENWTASSFGVHRSKEMQPGGGVRGVNHSTANKQCLKRCDGENNNNKKKIQCRQGVHSLKFTGRHNRAWVIWCNFRQKPKFGGLQTGGRVNN